jgi:O-antigen ligase
MTLAILSTGSRGAFVVLILITMINLLRYFTKVRNVKMFLHMISIVLFIIIIGVLFSDFLPFNTVQRLTSFNTYKNDIRLVLWAKAMQLFFKSPLIGSGMESANIYLVQLMNFNTHNLYIDILVNQGIIGFIIFSISVLRFIHVRKSDRFFMFMMIVCFFAPIFFVNGFNTATFWTPLILCQLFSNYSRYSPEGLLDVIK